jgi:hypothetical protein
MGCLYPIRAHFERIENKSAGQAKGSSRTWVNGTLISMVNAQLNFSVNASSKRRQPAISA